MWILPKYALERRLRRCLSACRYLEEIHGRIPTVDELELMWSDRDAAEGAYCLISALSSLGLVCGDGVNGARLTELGHAVADDTVPMEVPA
jgi:hypothetical protein